MRLVALLQYGFMVLATLVLAPTAILLATMGWRRAVYLPVKIWARLLHLSTGVRSHAHELHNVPQDTSYVVVANHCSHLDGPALAEALPHPVYFVIKKELARIPLWGRANLKIGFISVDRSDKEQARQQMRSAVASIREGRRILVFAEGTRSPDGRLQAFKKGGFHLAVDAQVPILPVAVNGSRKLLPKGGFVISPGVIDVVVCEPISTRNLDSGQVPELIERARDAILEARRRDPDFPDGGATTGGGAPRDRTFV